MDRRLYRTLSTFFKSHTTSKMPIDLGLTRVARLLSNLGNPHSKYKSIHVAGTNGKGSTLAYISSILTRGQIRNGRFTSPHILDYNDCISINNETYPLKEFEKVRELVVQKDETLKLGCTEFELLTATAFKIFEIERVEMALVEVGLGGRLDATNVLKPYGLADHNGGVVVSGITKIGLDHEKLLGSTLEEIAKEKAGIIKAAVPVIVDVSNDRSVLSVIIEKAAQEGANLIYADSSKNDLVKKLISHSPLKGDYQSQNLAVALSIIDSLCPQIKENLTYTVIEKGIQDTVWPGRLQSIKDPRTDVEVLLDGAHNESAAIELGKYLKHTRAEKNGLIFVIALTKGKSIDGLLKHLNFSSRDTLIPFHFTPPLEMPWVKPYDKESIAKSANYYLEDVREHQVTSVEDLFLFLGEMRQAKDLRAIVICGSLYLCSDVLRYIR